MIIGESLANGMAKRYLREMGDTFDRVFCALAATSGAPVHKNAGKRTRKMLKVVQRLSSPWIVAPPTIIGTKRTQIVLVVAMRPISEDAGEIVSVYADHSNYRIEPTPMQFTRHSLARLMQTYRSTDRDEIVTTLLALAGQIVDNIEHDAVFREATFYDVEDDDQVVAFILSREPSEAKIAGIKNYPTLRLKTVIRGANASGKHRHTLNVMRRRNVSKLVQLENMGIRSDA